MCITVVPSNIVAKEMVVMKRGFQKCLYLWAFLFLMCGLGWCEEEPQDAQIEDETGLEVKTLEKPASSFIKIKLGEAEFSGLLQTLYSQDSTAIDTFRMRNAELKLTGSFNSWSEYFIMIDPAKDLKVGADNKILQDCGFFLKSAVWGYPLKVTVGQIKIPVTMEGLQASAALETIERATIVKNTGVKRDQGVKFDAAISPLHLKYTLGVFNGEGSNVNDVNEHKDLAGRVVWQSPSVVGLHLGASLYKGRQGVNSVDKDRQGVEFQYARNAYIVKAEYLEADNNTIDSRGWYGLFGYDLDALDQVWSTNFFTQSQFVLRYDRNDINVDDDLYMDTLTVGVNHFLQGDNSKFQVNYLRMDGRGGLADGNGLSVFYQIRF